MKHISQYSCPCGESIIERKNTVALERLHIVQELGEMILSRPVNPRRDTLYTVQSVRRRMNAHGIVEIPT